MTSPAKADPIELSVWVAKTILDWIKTQDGVKDKQQANFTVGVTKGGRIIISKVGGITKASAIMKDLKTNITTFPWYHKSLEIYTAQTFSELGNSNHGEMCVLAASDAMVDPLIYMLCAGDNCAACHDTLLSAKVMSGNAKADGTQAGWSHPRAKIALGNQLSSSWEKQIEELHRYNTSSDEEKKSFTSTHLQMLYGAPAGSFERLV
ncbi:hypothetical protein Rhe02_35140 [Rhizocola hellebori]|uniref:Uncharacterized protein n=1 Tax=Rhizocola hellebori TaxID=1392758 RepID=A0A8J3Q8T5_9ACTN|nr:hypothetical protein [Rhizocola hellebori]GIH05447.1 hypothetical protein Rhe02_35140 [Rhizocola hellebori]